MRRQRFTVNYSPHGSNAVEQGVVLAYSAAEASDYYHRRGNLVLGVEKGDYRTHGREATVGEPWDFNMRAIHAAFEAMADAPLPAGLRFRKGRATRNQRGLFAVHVTKGLEVRVARNQTAASANETLWHELCHVAQYVRHVAAGGDTLSYVRQQNAANSDGRGYLNRPHEREAREWEALAETDFLLTTPTKGAIQ